MNPALANEVGHSQLEEAAAAVGFWWHSIDLGKGVITKGWKSPEVLSRELQSLRLPPLEGKSVLDIGAYDGYYSFEAEKRGAKRVVAIDHYAWSLDLPKAIDLWKECKEKGIAPPLPELTPYWRPDTLPGMRGYRLAHSALASKVETVIDDFMTTDLSALGSFDVVLFLGVLYHMENPLASLRRVASLTAQTAIIETHAVSLPDCEHLEVCEFYSSNQLNGDVSNWWGPNINALRGMCRAAGFRDVEVVADSRERGSLIGNLRGAAGHFRRKLRSPSLFFKKVPRYFRVVVHATK